MIEINLLPGAKRRRGGKGFHFALPDVKALAGLVKELGHLANLDELFQRAATTVHSQMQLSRVLVLVQDPRNGFRSSIRGNHLHLDRPTEHVRRGGSLFAHLDAKLGAQVGHGGGGSFDSE